MGCHYLALVGSPGAGNQDPDLRGSLEVFNVGVWLTHGDVALEAKVDCLVVVEHRLIPASVVSGLG